MLRVTLRMIVMLIAFSALTLLVGCQEEHPVCKNWVMRCWRGCLSGVRCKWFAYGPADATATPSSLASLKSRMVEPFWCRLTQVVPENRPSVECLVAVSDVCVCCCRCDEYVTALFASSCSLLCRYILVYYCVGQWLLHSTVSYRRCWLAVVP